MKKVFVGILLLLCVVQLQAQTWNEWFRQKKTQIKYLGQQIAALQIYIELGQKGYGIAKDGLNLINDIKQGDFDLHSGYFHSLLVVNERVSSSGKVIFIYATRQLIIQEIDNNKKVISQHDLINTNEREYIERVWANLLKKLDDNISELELLLMDGQYSLKDDERLKRMDTVYSSVLQQYRFSKQFSKQVQLLLVGKQKETNEGKVIERMYQTELP